MKNLAVFINQFSETNDLMIKFRRGRIHIRIGIENRLRFVMRPQDSRNRTNRRQPIYARRPSARD